MSRSPALLLKNNDKMAAEAIKQHKRRKRDSNFHSTTEFQWDIITYFSPHSAGIFLYKPWRLNVFFQPEIIINVLVSSFCFI